MTTHAASRGPFRTSHLRQVSTGSSSAVEKDKISTNEATGPIETSHPLGQVATYQQYLTVSIHDENISKELVLLSLSPGSDVRNGDLLQALPLRNDSSTNENEPLDSSAGLRFLYKTVGQEVLAKLQPLQISIARRVAGHFGFEKGRQVFVKAVDRHQNHATHVEIIFRDQYLARADMWRLIVSELSDTCIYTGQKIEFLGSVRAHVKNIFTHGRKMQSALFHPSTKPIFRSGSARYVLFIQMSKEMWDFDAEGSGEIMFDKIINGFLPELFKRWRELKVKHLISIVLFTRMIYEEHIDSSADASKFNPKQDHGSNATRPKSSKDFYRVIVTDISSSDWADILNQLKREFKVFLRDISIRKPDTGDHLPLGEGLSSALTDTPGHVIAGHPSSASSGNLLEAINLASSQFSSDYIDRDLVRTGVSVMVISPGAGVFEVDYELLVATTENLIDNGVGIDLVCLSRMPLHSVPLFKYRTPSTVPEKVTLANTDNVKEDENTPTGSLIGGNSGGNSSGTPPSLLVPDIMNKQKINLRQKSSQDWSYGIPHWVDISFWNSTPGENALKQLISRKPKDKSSFDTPQHKTFIPRVKMYELQMMGVMENEASNISIPLLSQSFRIPTQHNHLISTAISSSPKTANKNSTSNSPRSQLNDTHVPALALSTSVASDRSALEKSVRPQFQWMDVYDDLVFRHPLVASKRSRRLKSAKHYSKNKESHGYSPSLLGTSASTRQKLSNKDGRGSRKTDHPVRDMRSSKPKSSKEDFIDGKSTSDRLARPKMEKSTRHISFGPRGLSAKAVASTEVTTQHGEGSLLSRGLRSNFSAKPVGTSPTPHKTQLKPGEQVSQEKEVTILEATQSSESESQQSRPIPIRNSTAIRLTGDGQSRFISNRRDFHDLDGSSQTQDRLAALQDMRERAEDIPGLGLNGEEDVQPTAGALSPSTTLAPWLTILNPSNPSKTKMALASRLGRWQHAFPRPLKTSQIKWKSLCSPAAIPLTTEEFPSAEQLAEEYEGTAYDIELAKSSELSEVPRSLVTEIIAFRLSRGFQMVVGPRIVESTKISALSALNVFDEHILEENGTSIFLSRGSTIHRISRIDANKVEIKQLFRYGGDTPNKAESLLYKPFIRSTLGQDFVPHEISIAPHRSNFDWKAIDAFIIGHERPQAQDFVENLRPWRARFVLIPVEAPSSLRRRQRADEDDEEEIRLEGIHKLSQVWQRFRYVPPEERRYQAPLRNRKDTNPLDIMYQTRNPSAIVAAELESVAEGDATGRPVQLLPESDLFQRSNFKVANLAETIQGEKGVRMLDRRWHLRLHYNCFIGFELTSWLLQNFRDVDTRDEAIELGNELMKNGMFRHVEQRHNFRDGNYFYQIADEYRTPRPESRGWFGRTKASVPSTPLTEDLIKELPMTGRSRSSSNSDSTEEEDPTTPTEKKRKQLSVALSKSLIYDVDHRKRSYRPELINLHYDRLHNPDNCYHIRVEWMNTTAKLIQDAVLSWATSVDRFGLRLVEVPLGEISSISSMHPFRAPYRVKLAQKPPIKQPQSYFDSTSFAPQPRAEENFYQKAIMKRFNFVLDYEAASDFPADVDVTFSWGKPDYRYSQYIHRSGFLIAQITDDGDFLLLANRLYNKRNATDTSYHGGNPKERPGGENDQNRSPGFSRSSPHRGSHAPARPNPSPHDSPYSSPSVRATLDIPPSSSRGPSSHLSAFPKHIDPTRPSPTTSSVSADATKDEFEAFCHNPESLSLFYEEVLSKASTPGPNTPFMESNKTPGGKMTAAAEAGINNESSIPTLALPGRLVEKRDGGEIKTVSSKGTMS